MPFLIDIENVSCECSNHAIEYLFKASAEGGDGADIWDEHQSPFVKRLIELFTDRGLMRISSLQTELVRWLNHERYKGGERKPRPVGQVDRWTDGELALARLYLESLPPAEFTIDDWMLVIDWLAQRYFPPDQLWPEAEWLATKAAIMGRVQARMGELKEQPAEALLAAAPVTVAEVDRRFGMTVAQSSMLRYGRARCAENITTVSAALKHRIKSVILEYQKGVALGDPTIRESLQTRLQDAFATANTDWRRIAVTEAGENQLQGLIASLPKGAKVRRVEQYKGACQFCRKIDGMEFEVIPADEAAGADPWKAVWTGKTNVGRSAAPRKRVSGRLVEREESEMWIPAAGTMHPHCRGTWVEVKEPDSAGDAEFTAWMRSVLEKK